MESIAHKRHAASLVSSYRLDLGSLQQLAPVARPWAMGQWGVELQETCNELGSWPRAQNISAVDSTVALPTQVSMYTKHRIEVHHHSLTRTSWEAQPQAQTIIAIIAGPIQLLLWASKLNSALT